MSAPAMAACATARTRLLVLLVLLAHPAAPVSLSMEPRAAAWTANALITLDTGTTAISAGAKCEFEGGASLQPCSVDGTQPTRCSCTAPTSADLLGDVEVKLLPSGGGAALGASTLTYYAAEQPPTLLSFGPVGADCTSGGVTVEVRGRNFAPTANLICQFGELGVSAANFTSASRAAEEASEAVVRCEVPATALLGDVRLRVSNDGGARWSEPSTRLFTCHDAARPPELLSVQPEAVDLAAVRNGTADGAETATTSLASVAVRARNLRRGVTLTARFGGATSSAAGGGGSGGGAATELSPPVETNCSLVEVSLGTAAQTVGWASCALPALGSGGSGGGGGGADEAAEGAAVATGRLSLQLSADGGASWSALTHLSYLATFDSDAPPSLIGATPSSLAIAPRVGGVGATHAAGSARAIASAGDAAALDDHLSRMPPPSRGLRTHHLHLGATNVAPNGSSCEIVCNSSQLLYPGATEACGARYEATVVSSPFGGAPPPSPRHTHTHTTTTPHLLPSRTLTVPSISPSLSISAMACLAPPYPSWRSHPPILPSSHPPILPSSHPPILPSSPSRVGVADVSCAVAIPPWVGAIGLRLRSPTRWDGASPDPSNVTWLQLHDPTAPPVLTAVEPTEWRLRTGDGGAPRMHEPRPAADFESCRTDPSPSLPVPRSLSLVARIESQSSESFR